MVSDAMRSCMARHSVMRGKIDNEENAAGLQPRDQPLRSKMAVVYVVEAKTDAGNVKVVKVGAFKRLRRRVIFFKQVA